MSTDPLDAHSVAEALLYLRSTPCGTCGRGPLRGSEPDPVDGVDQETTIAIRATCAGCQSVETVTFRVPAQPQTADRRDPAPVNPTDEPSHLLDVGQWITLARVITESAEKETDKVRVRVMKLEAAQCLEEALKFYDEVDNDLPPPEAFFVEVSRERFRKAPERFSRQRLIGLLSKLPSPIKPSSDAPPRPNRWWRR